MSPSIHSGKAALAGLALALLLAGCSREPEETRASISGASAAPAPEQSQAEAAPLPDLPAARPPPLRGPLAEKYAKKDSSADVWDTEVFNEAAGAQLSKLGKLLALAGEAGAEGGLGDIAAAEFRCRPLRPGPLRAVRETAALRVLEPDPDAEEGPELAGPKGLAEALRGLAVPFDGSEPRAKFKIVSVEPSGEEVATEVIVLIDGAPEGGRVQQNARWRCRWTREAPPRLLAIDVSHHQEVLGPPGGETLFADCTEAVLGGNPSFREQLAPDLAHWAARVDANLGMSLIGHQGLAVGDADGDGLDDLYVCQPGGLPNRLYLQQPDGTARDATEASGVDFLDSSRSALFLDLDGDGDQDLVVELDPSILLCENDGMGRFTVRGEVRAPNTTSISAADFDGDGDVDLYACGYMLPDVENRTPIPYHDANNGRPNALLRNDIGPDGWVFTDVTRLVGLDQNNRRFSFAAAWEDYDDDGDPDLYVSNDYGRNNLYRNDGGRFVDVAAEAGVEDMAAGMGVTWADYDLDGRLDLYVSNMFSSAGERITYQRRFKPSADPAVRAGYQRHARGNTLFRNEGDGTFRDVSEEAGVTMGRWAWGAVFLDLDSDRRPDLFVPNGFVTGDDPHDL